MLRSWLLLLFSLAPLAAVAAPFNVFADGETFTYKVAWAVFPGAGRIVIAAHDDVLQGRPVVQLTVDTTTRGVVRVFYNYEDKAVALVDRITGQLIRASDKGGGGGKQTSDSETTFDYRTRKVTHVNRARPGRSRTFDLPPGEPIDLISCLIDTRNWNVKPGDKRDAVVYFDNDVYPVTITAMDYEPVDTALGSFRALRLEPAMTHDAKGIFARQGQIQVWVSQDTPRLPVKMQLHLKLGTATLTLIKHDPGKPSPPGL